MLFERLWLRALDEGLAVVPASQPLQEYEAMAGHYAEIHESFALPGQTIQMVALFGVPDEGYRRGFRIDALDLVRD